MWKAKYHSLTTLTSTLIVVLALSMQSCQPTNSGDNRKNPVSTRQGATNTLNSNLQNINAQSLIVTQNSRMISLADIAKNSPSNITVFYFMGVTCTSCFSEGPQVASTIRKYAGQAREIVIFPNKIDQYQTYEYQNFVQKYADNSQYVFDESLNVIKTVRANVGQYFGVIILVDRNGMGKILNQESSYLNLDSELSRALSQSY